MTYLKWLLNTGVEKNTPTNEHEMIPKGKTDRVIPDVYVSFRNTFSDLSLAKWILGRENVLLTPNLTASQL